MFNYCENILSILCRIRLRYRWNRKIKKIILEFYVWLLTSCFWFFTSAHSPNQLSLQYPDEYYIAPGRYCLYVLEWFSFFHQGLANFQANEKKINASNTSWVCFHNFFYFHFYAIQVKSHRSCFYAHYSYHTGSKRSGHQVSWRKTFSFPLLSIGASVSKDEEERRWVQAVLNSPLYITVDVIIFCLNLRHQHIKHCEKTYSVLSTYCRFIISLCARFYC